MTAVPLPPRVLVADRGDAGRRVDLVIRRHLTDLANATRTRVQAWIEDGRVTINGRVVRRVSVRAALGDSVVVLLPDEEPREPVIPESGPLEQLYEDDYVLVVNKPAGMVSHPTFLHPRGSLLNISESRSPSSIARELQQRPERRCVATYLLTWNSRRGNMSRQRM